LTVDKIFEELGAYYAPYPELSDLLLSEIATLGSASSRDLLSRYKPVYARHRVVRAIQNLISLKLLNSVGLNLSLRIETEQVQKLKAYNFTQIQMRILTFIRLNGTVYYNPFYMQTRANRTPFNQATRKLINLNLLEMHKESTKRGGVNRHVYSFKTVDAHKSNPGAIMLHTKSNV